MNSSFSQKATRLAARRTRTFFTRLVVLESRAACILRIGTAGDLKFRGLTTFDKKAEFEWSARVDFPLGQDGLHLCLRELNADPLFGSMPLDDLRGLLRSNSLRQRRSLTSEPLGLSRVHVPSPLGDGSSTVCTSHDIRPADRIRNR